MILPSKHVHASQSLLGVGSLLLRILDRPRSVSDTWENMSRSPEQVTYDRFILALCFLYVIGLVELEAGILKRRRL
jgi:hypothetical protein